MADKNIRFDINQLAGGGAREQIEREVKKIMANILDMNTDDKKKQTLTVKVEFSPDENRKTINTHVSIKSTLAPQSAIGTIKLVGRDNNTGIIQAAELHSNMPGQTYFDPEDSTLKTDIGDPIAESDDSYNPIIDFNKKKVSK